MSVQLEDEGSNASSEEHDQAVMVYCLDNSIKHN